MASLMSKEKELEAKEKTKKAESGIVKKMVSKSSDAKKTKAVSLKVNPEMWERFRQINKKCGSTCNGMISQLIANFVYEKEKEFRDLEVK